MGLTRRDVIKGGAALLGLAATGCWNDILNPTGAESDEPEDEPPEDKLSQFEDTLFPELDALPPEKISEAVDINNLGRSIGEYLNHNGKITPLSEIQGKEHPRLQKVKEESDRRFAIAMEPAMEVVDYDRLYEGYVKYFRSASYRESPNFDPSYKLTEPEKFKAYVKDLLINDLHNHWREAQKLFPDHSQFFHTPDSDYVREIIDAIDHAPIPEDNWLINRGNADFFAAAARCLDRKIKKHYLKGTAFSESYELLEGGPLEGLTLGDLAFQVRNQNFATPEEMDEWSLSRYGFRTSKTYGLTPELTATHIFERELALQKMQAQEDDIVDTVLNAFKNYTNTTSSDNMDILFYKPEGFRLQFSPDSRPYEALADLEKRYPGKLRMNYADEPRFSDYIYLNLDTALERPVNLLSAIVHEVGHKLPDYSGGDYHMQWGFLSHTTEIGHHINELMNLRLQYSVFQHGEYISDDQVEADVALRRIDDLLESSTGNTTFDYYFSSNLSGCEKAIDSVLGIEGRGHTIMSAIDQGNYKEATRLLTR